MARRKVSGNGALESAHRQSTRKFWVIYLHVRKVMSRDGFVIESIRGT